jgi:hypothetical protein
MTVFPLSLDIRHFLFDIRYSRSAVLPSPRIAWEGSTAEPMNRNVEQGMSNAQGKVVFFPWAFDIPCSTFDILVLRFFLPPASMI